MADLKQFSTKQLFQFLDESRMDEGFYYINDITITNKELETEIINRRNNMVDLKQYHTKQLLAFLDEMRAVGDILDVTDNHNLDMTITKEELKAELATREHIPNKKEARIIRQQKAKNKK